MIVGDFVKLSAYGRGLRGNRSLQEIFGVVIERHTLIDKKEFYFIHWLDGDRTIASRREIKYLN